MDTNMDNIRKNKLYTYIDILTSPILYYIESSPETPITCKEWSAINNIFSCAILSGNISKKIYERIYDALRAKKIGDLEDNEQVIKRSTLANVKKSTEHATSIIEMSQRVQKPIKGRIIPSRDYDIFYPESHLIKKECVNIEEALRTVVQTMSTTSESTFKEWKMISYMIIIANEAELISSESISFFISALINRKVKVMISQKREYKAIIKELESIYKAHKRRQSR